MYYIECEVNGKKYVIMDNHTGDKFYWWSCELEGDYKDTPCEAMQDLLDSIAEEISLKEEAEREESEDEKYGSYREQVNELWESTRL